jgi:hypothetical protein
MTTSAALFLVAWGIFATSMGLVTATNYRGFVDQMTAERRRAARSLRRVPPWRWFPDRQPREGSRWVVRAVGVVFAVTGPVALVVGIVFLTTHPWHMPRIDAHPHLNAVSVIGGAAILVGSVVLWWPHSGQLWLAWRRGGFARLAAVDNSVALLVMAVGWVTMITPVFICGWVIGIPGSIYMALTQYRRAST